MIQRKGQLCYGAMKLAEWPTLSFVVSKVLWPGILKGQIRTATNYRFSTKVQSQDSRKDKSQQQGSSKRVPETEQSVTVTSSTVVASPQANSKLLFTNASTESSHQIKKPLSKVFETPSNLATPSKLYETPQKELEAVLKVKSLSEALHVSSKFNASQCVATLKNLAVSKTRPVPLIHSISNTMLNSVKWLSIKEISDLLFCLSKLNYVDEKLLSEASKCLKDHLKRVKNAALVGSSISSLRRLQWKDTELLNELSVWMVENFKSFQNPSSFIYTLALQNHSPENLDELLPLVWNNVTEDGRNPVDFVNLMWAMSLLNSTVSQTILEDNLTVLFNPAFLKKLDDGPHMTVVWNQLRNLHAASKYFMKKTTRLPLPDHHCTYERAGVPVKSEKVIMTSLVKELLFKDMNTNLYSTFVPSNMGFSIDLVLNLDDKMRALPVDMTAASCNRVAVMIHTYHECCRPSKEPNGCRVYEMKLLQDKFKVVSVPYNVLDGSPAEVHAYFENALNKALMTKV